MQFLPPKKLREANIQAELYHRLKELGIPSYLEYSFKDFANNRRRRADLVVYKNNKIVCLVEAKSRIRSFQPNWNTKQLKAYRATGVFVIVCDNFNLEESVNKIKELYDKFI